MESVAQQKTPLQSLRLVPSSHNLMVSPTWRWERADWLITNNRHARKKREDPWVCLAVKFQRELQRCDDFASYERLRVKYPGLYAAWEFFRSTEVSTRWSFEAYLCADATIEHIAERSGEHKESIYCYSKLFFDVAGKTRHWLYMINRVLGPSVHAGLSDRQYDLLWKLYGLLRGPLFLDTIIRYDDQPVRMTAYSQSGTMKKALIKTNLANKALITSRTIRVDYNQEIILASYNKMVEIEEAGGGSEGAQTLIVNNITKTITNFGFEVADEAVMGLQPHYLENGVELRSKDLVLRAFGDTDVDPRMQIGDFPEEIEETAVETTVQ